MEEILEDAQLKISVVISACSGPAAAGSWTPSLAGSAARRRSPRWAIRIVVRLLLVTALSLDLGRRMWWPSKLARKPDPATEELGRERAAALVAG